MTPHDIEALARRVIETAAAKGLMLATAESCTGGLVAGALTGVAGSSAVVGVHLHDRDHCPGGAGLRGRLRGFYGDRDQLDRKAGGKLGLACL